MARVGQSFVEALHDANDPLHGSLTFLLGAFARLKGQNKSLDRKCRLVQVGERLLQELSVFPRHAPRPRLSIPGWPQLHARPELPQTNTKSVDGAKSRGRLLFKGGCGDGHPEGPNCVT